MKHITKEDVFGDDFFKKIKELIDYTELRQREINTDVYTSIFDKKIELKRLEKKFKETFLCIINSFKMKQYYIIANHSLSESEAMNLFKKSKHGDKEVCLIQKITDYKYEITYKL